MASKKAAAPPSKAGATTTAGAGKGTSAPRDASFSVEGGTALRSRIAAEEDAAAQFGSKWEPLLPAGHPRTVEEALAKSRAEVAALKAELGAVAATASVQEAMLAASAGAAAAERAERQGKT